MQYCKLAVHEAIPQFCIDLGILTKESKWAAIHFCVAMISNCFFSER
jgi:hypothetical protein